MRKGTRQKVAADRSDVRRLEDLPNVGAAVARDLRRIDIHEPRDAVGKDPYEMYERLCRVTNQRHDPCMLDTFIAVVRFMERGEARPWWAYTAERKRRLAEPRQADE